MPGNPATQHMEFVVYEEGYRAAWTRTAGITSDNVIFLPVVMSIVYNNSGSYGTKRLEKDAENQAVLAAGRAGIFIVRYERHFYVPSDYIIQVRPERAKRIERIAQLVNEAMLSSKQR